MLPLKEEPDLLPDCQPEQIVAMLSEKTLVDSVKNKPGAAPPLLWCDSHTANFWGRGTP